MNLHCVSWCSAVQWGFGADLEQGAYTSTSRARYHSGKNELGVYGWLPPIGPRALERRPALASSGTVVMSGTFPLDDGSAYEVFRIDTTATSVGANPALDFVMTLQTALEYATTDQWAELEYSVIDSVTALRCLQTAARCEVFADNPVHLRDIVSFLRQPHTDRHSKGCKGARGHCYK